MPSCIGTGAGCARYCAAFPRNSPAARPVIGRSPWERRRRLRRHRWPLGGRSARIRSAQARRLEEQRLEAEWQQRKALLFVTLEQERRQAVAAAGLREADWPLLALPSNRRPLVPLEEPRRAFP